MRRRLGLALWSAGSLGLLALAGCGEEQTGPLSGSGLIGAGGRLGSAGSSAGVPAAGSMSMPTAGAAGAAGRVGGAGGVAAAGRNASVAGSGGSKAGGGGRSEAGGGAGARGGTVGASGASGANDAGAESGGSASGCADLPVCDDFETYVQGQAPNGIWSKEGGGSAKVDSTRPHRGDQSVHIVTGESEDGRVWLHTTTNRLFPTRHFFGRLWLYLDALPTTEVHWDMIEGQGTADEPAAWDDPFEIALRYGGQLDENFLANFETPGSYSGDGPSTDCAKFSDTRMPYARWSCMEWEFDSDNEVMRFWLDGNAVDDLEVHEQGTQCISDGTNGVWYYPTFESLNLGWREWWEAGTRELWIDDVALATERIGCD
jgi:hypothetical protein